MAAADRKTLYDFQKKVAKLDRAISGAISLSNELRNRVRSVRRALRETPANTAALIDKADALDKRVTEELRALRGDTASISRQEVPFPPSLSGRVNNIIGDQFTSTSLPTTTHQTDYSIAAEGFAQELPKVKALAEEISALEKEAEKLGAPWTTGRVPEWQDQ
jgi:ABC-type transporter Mla subunit MlaD